MLQSESRFCSACESFFHSPETCPKALPTYQPVSNELVGTGANIGTTDLRVQTLLSSQQYIVDTLAAGLAWELRLRSALAEGVGDECRRCEKHNKMHLQRLQEPPKRRRSFVPIVPDYFDDSHVAERSLLPICSVCVYAETGIEQRALASRLDMCRCATMLARAACPNCVLGEINGAMKYAVLTRMKPSTDGSCKIACGCGNEVRVQETAMQCVHCCGIATAPFYGYGGDFLEYECGAEAPMSCTGLKAPEKMQHE